MSKVEAGTNSNIDRENKTVDSLAVPPRPPVCSKSTAMKRVLYGRCTDEVRCDGTTWDLRAFMQQTWSAGQGR